MAAVRRLLEENRHEARDHLLEIQRLIAEEQRDLRFLVRELKSATLQASTADFGLVTRLKAVGEQIERQWGLRVELGVKLSEPQLPTELTHEIYYIVHEALVNAARHACASSVCAEIDRQDDHVRITVADNGRGFPFRGHYALPALMALQLGPVMLRDRVASLGGTLDPRVDGGRIVSGHLPARSHLLASTRQISGVLAYDGLGSGTQRFSKTLPMVLGTPARKMQMGVQLYS